MIPLLYWVAERVPDEVTDGRADWRQIGATKASRRLPDGRLICSMEFRNWTIAGSLAVSQPSRSGIRMED